MNASTISENNLSSYYVYDTYETDDEFMNFTKTFQYEIGEFMTYYYTPGVVLFGVVGNILSVIVFLKTKLRFLSSSCYLAALGINDTCFLLGTFVAWLNFFNINIYDENYYCQFFTYMSGLCCFLSAWLVVAFTVERFIEVVYPLKRETMCTVKRACIVSSGLVLIGTLICIPFAVFASPRYSEYVDEATCNVGDKYEVRFDSK
jgi:hypothetical protein